MSEQPPKFLLRHTNPYGEHHYLVSLGDQWPNHHGRKLISMTTESTERARKFETIPDAVAILQEAGDPHGWEVISAP